HTFLFELDDGRCIDAGPKGSGDAKFINHSCEPNCEAIGEDDRVFIDTLTDLEAGDELLYDYRYMVEGPIDAETKALYACRCGAKTCRGSILAPVKPKKKPKKKTKKKAATRR
ncbi:MAG: SET domain-containing protein-lysine N-methyltransferase, partial [Polyangiaceae bacterium]